MGARSISDPTAPSPSMHELQGRFMQLRGKLSDAELSQVESALLRLRLERSPTAHFRLAQLLDQLSQNHP